MKSATLPSFWNAYRSLRESTKKSARKSYKLWEENPFHPSFHFKCVNTPENIWSVCITRGYRALGVLDEDTVTWFWIGSHDEYIKAFKQGKRGCRTRRCTGSPKKPAPSELFVAT